MSLSVRVPVYFIFLEFHHGGSEGGVGWGGVRCISNKVFFGCCFRIETVSVCVCVETVVFYPLVVFVSLSLPLLWDDTKTGLVSIIILINLSLVYLQYSFFLHFILSKH